MSRIARNLECSLVEIPLKTFVKEGNDAAKPGKRSNFILEFKANEAKLVYDEIVSQKSQNNAVLSGCKKAPLKKPKVKGIDGIKNIDTNVNNINTLFKAIESGDFNFISKHFSSKNVNISDQFGWTPLMAAAYSGDVRIVEFLLKLNANAKAIDKSGFTAVDLAGKKNYFDIVNLIKEYLCTNRRKEIVARNDKVSNGNENADKRLNQEGFYCNVCKHYFMDCSKNRHESSTLHIFNGEPKLKNTFYGIPKQNKGYQMLLNTGWKEDGGLGPSGEGKKYPIKTVLKRDRKGLGQLHKKIAKITHFNSRDIEAVKFVNRNKKKLLNKKEWERELKKEIVKTKILRQALS
ncbi:PREDICTED: G patch domain and ankyrin repeat-containing protein 1 homolog [Ceratosolen solmsi marchali]|uniref:G patch domain and ankyrin repeat-containing protein 1 homolog n=1 Tax=Ceratosolen solmsi marchali TaxID=326594 RepID=A0AAJ6YBM0_9HYME|nr:PREDICTED: G patch domain and ankyrin repeat-containing protein 1 homolog [Ceratosolen solmsi marchali]